MIRKFYKIIFLFLTLSFVSPSFVYAGLGEITSGVKKIVRTTKNDNSGEKSKGTKIYDSLNPNSSSIVVFLKNFITKTMETCIGFFNGKLNTISDGRTNEGMMDTEHQSRGKTISLVGSEKNTFSAKGRSWSVFMIMVCIWLMMSCFYFCYKRVSDPNFQVREIPLILVKLILIMLLFWFSPKLTDFFVQFVWWAAEVSVKGTSAVGTMSYTALISYIVNGTQLALLGGTLAATGTISMTHLTVFGVGITGAAFGNITQMIVFLIFASVLISTMVTLMYCVWILELYIATWVLIMYLPSTLFNGFELKAMSVLKFYFTNALEIFMGAVIVLLFQEIFASINIAGNNIFLQVLDLFLKPLILLIIFPATSKICDAIIKGGGVADTSNAVTEAAKTTSSAMTGGAVAGLGAGAANLSNLVRGKIASGRNGNSSGSSNASGSPTSQQNTQQQNLGSLKNFQNSHTNPNP